MKDDSLYSSGMKPFVYSLKKKREQGVGWHRGGFNILYNPNGQTIRTSSKTVRFDLIKIKVEHSWTRNLIQVTLISPEISSSRTAP